MDDPKPEDPGGTPSDPCKCEELPKDLPLETAPFRRLLDALTEELKKLPRSSEASTKFPDDLKEAEKEYQGIDAVVAKYREFYDKQLDCKLADVRRWRALIEKWSTTDPDARKAIEEFRNTNYNGREKTICCDTWNRLREELNACSDCLVRARNAEARKQEAYDKLKGFLDALTKIFSELEALFKKAEAFNKDQKPKSVYAVSLEFDDLFELIDWPKTDEDKCAANGGGGTTPTGGEYAQEPPTTPPQGGGYGQTPGGGGYGQTPETPTEGSYEGEGSAQSDRLKEELSPDKFRGRLLAALRALLLAKFLRFKEHHKFLLKTADVADAKKECEKFRTDRQKLFLEEVEDIPTGSGTGNGGGGTGGGGGYQQQPPGGGGYQQQPPGGGGYQQQPPGGGGYQQQQPPGGGGYQQQQPPGGGGYQQQKPTKGTYRQEPPTGGYPQESSSKGGYEPQGPTGGQEKS